MDLEALELELCLGRRKLGVGLCDHNVVVRCIVCNDWELLGRDCPVSWLVQSGLVLSLLRGEFGLK